MVVAGIDLSTRCIDLVLLNLDDDRAQWHRYELEGVDLVERIRQLHHTDLIVGLKWGAAWCWEDVLAVGIERPAGRFGVAQVSMAFGAVLASLPRGLLVKPWLPAEWKRACGMKGNASKDEVAIWATEQRGATYYYSEGKFAGWPQDACDAYCIAWATRSVIELETAA